MNLGSHFQFVLCLAVLVVAFGDLPPLPRTGPAKVTHPLTCRMRLHASTYDVGLYGQRDRARRRHGMHVGYA
jgi:hypothetical protein